MDDQILRPLELYLQSTPLAFFVRQTAWSWPALESLHFLGMALLVGTVGIFDLRLLGYARELPATVLHRMIPLGVAGFALNAATGICFLSAYPRLFLYNNAFYVKLAFFVIAGINVLFFYVGPFKRLAEMDGDGVPPLRARIAGGVSLCAWIGVMAAGRLLTFFKPL